MVLLYCISNSTWLFSGGLSSFSHVFNCSYGYFLTSPIRERSDASDAPLCFAWFKKMMMICCAWENFPWRSFGFLWLRGTWCPNSDESRSAFARNILALSSSLISSYCSGTIGVRLETLRSEVEFIIEDLPAWGSYLSISPSFYKILSFACQ